MTCQIVLPENGMYIKNEDFPSWQDDFARLVNTVSDSQEMKVRNVTFVVTEQCNLNCTYCLAAGTQITLADFTTKSIENIEKGDVVIGFEEKKNGRYKQRTIFPTVVTKTMSREDETIKITFEDDTSIVVTPGHPLLSKRSNVNNGWKDAGDFKVGQEVMSLPLIEFCSINYDKINYKIGYFVAMMLGDGSVNKYIDKNGYDMYKIRLAVKDSEIIERMKEYSKSLGVCFYEKPYKISSYKGDIYEVALFANTKIEYDKINKVIKDNFNINKTIEYQCGFLAGIYDAEGSIDKINSTIRITNSDTSIMKEVEMALKSINIKYIFDKHKKSTNKIVQTIRIKTQKKTMDNLRFLKLTNPAVKRKGYANLYNRSLLYSKKIKSIEEYGSQVVYNFETDSHTYLANSAGVHNCYETHKSSKRMTKEVGRKAVDMLFEKEKLNGYLETETAQGIILEFIGGEPLLEMDLIDYIVDYFKAKAFMLDHPWGKYYAISLTSNGVLYSDKKVSDFLKKNDGNVSLGITIDGNKELHDSCRVFHDGRPSYDIVEKSMKEHLKKYPKSSTKLTLSPENVSYLSGALENLHELNIRTVHGNLAFEEGWQNNHARVFYDELIKSADYILKNKTYRTDYVSYFDEDEFVLNDNLDKNHCGGNGTILAIGTDGRCFPCLRYMQYSLSEPGRKEIEIGDVDKGIDSEDDNPMIPALKRITMRTQSTEKCIKCPIGKGCTICNGYQYDKFGDPNIRATFICEMHQARSLANVYYWNKLYRELKIEKRFRMNIPKEWALEIIDEEEYNSLMALTEA